MRRTRLLVVEDHAATAGGMKTYLELMGYSVLVAGDAATARAMAQLRQFDVLVCDLNLPDGTGWDLLKDLKEEGPVHAIAFSAYDEPEYRENSKAAGFLDYVVKGVAPEILIEAIERAAPGLPPAIPEAAPASKAPPAPAARTSVAG